MAGQRQVVVAVAGAATPYSTYLEAAAAVANLLAAAVAREYLRSTYRLALAFALLRQKQV